MPNSRNHNTHTHTHTRARTHTFVQVLPFKVGVLLKARFVSFKTNNPIQTDRSVTDNNARYKPFVIFLADGISRNEACTSTYGLVW